MADKITPRSSYDDYMTTLKKLAPQLKTLLSHISSEQTGMQPPLLAAPDTSAVDTTIESVCAAGSPFEATARKKTSRTKSTPSKRSVKMGAPRSRRPMEDDNMMQAVTNCGKIVFGTVRDGKLEVKGTVGEVNADLLGVDLVNAGRKPRTTKSSGDTKPTRRRRQTTVMYNKDSIECPDSGMC
ncbi:virion core and cleavage processing protein [Pteropox virus]|uniref:25 kDa core protein OPG138 n=1 Tax=Pteropox virus TaxID=1873698 RepID=A0A1B1MRN0_9POXV|nr:virion core and cleavage processing protein [Pteropox virus]ANS71190.1 virion core and cleavage processing protein [Pteropox virus]